MAKAEYEKELKVILTLNEAEATWLKTIVQNPLCEDPEDEDEVSRDMRHSFWNALTRLEEFGYSDD